MLLAVGCDGVFGLTRVLPPPDAPTILDCTRTPIILRPSDISRLEWADQDPATGTHVDHVAESEPDDDLTYIASKIDGQLDLYTHLPIASTVTIDSVTVWIRARNETLPSSAQVGGAMQVGSALPWDDVYLGTAYSDLSSNVYATNPATNAPWTVDDVNGLSFGVRKAYSADRVRVTQIWAAVACH